MDKFFKSTNNNEILEALSILNKYGLIGDKISYGHDGILLSKLEIEDLDDYYGVDVCTDDTDGFYANKFPNVYSSKVFNNKRTCVSLMDGDNMNYGDHSEIIIENINEFKECVICFVNEA